MIGENFVVKVTPQNYIASIDRQKNVSIFKNKLMYGKQLGIPGVIPSSVSVNTIIYKLMCHFNNMTTVFICNQILKKFYIPCNI